MVMFICYTYFASLRTGFFITNYKEVRAMYNDDS